MSAQFGSILDEPPPTAQRSFNKERLCSLIRLLGTPVDGEQLGAVYGIDRILRAAGLSFHDLAQAVARSSLVVDGEQPSNDWIVAGREILEAGGLSPNEQKFVEQMLERFTSHTFEPTQKQMNWFVMIYRRVVKVKKRA